MATVAKRPAPPAGLGVAGRRLWNGVLREYGLTAADLEVLRQACVKADILAALAKQIQKDGPLVVDRFGEIRSNPALVEFRQLSNTYAKELASIRVIGEADDDADRPQRRVGYRGFQTGLHAVEEEAG